MNRSILIIS